MTLVSCVKNMAVNYPHASVSPFSLSRAKSSKTMSSSCSVLQVVTSLDGENKETSKKQTNYLLEFASDFKEKAKASLIKIDTNLLSLSYHTWKMKGE